MSFSSKIFSALIAIYLLSACASQDPKREVDAATAPLNDLNLIRADIPAVLTSAQEKPYAVPPDSSCTSLAREMGELDKVLGPDLDFKAANDPSNSSAAANLAQKGVDRVKDSAIGTIASVTQNVIPYRDWVRKLSGAEAYADKVTASILAGTARRSFLKGIWVAKECN